jgi:hypothetical protein
MEKDKSENNENVKCEAPRPEAGASRERNNILIVPLNPSYKAGLAGHLPVKIQMSNECQSPN